MNFSKVKIIIILCLFIVNIIFALLCTSLISQKNYISEEEAALAASNLLKNGIKTDFDKAARRLYNLPVYATEPVSAENYVPKIYSTLTESFFGVSVDDSAYVKTPDGYSVSVKNDEGILLGSSSLSDNTHFECYFEDTVSYKDVSDIGCLPYFSELDGGKNEEYNTAKKFMDSALDDYGMRFVYRGTMAYSDGTVVCFSSELSDTELYSIYLNVYVEKGKAVCCVGEIFDVAPVKKYSAKIVDSIDAVYLLSDYIRENANTVLTQEAEIKKISMVYDYYEYGYGEYYIIPTWIMEYKENDKASEIYAIDAVTGENIRKLD